MVLRQGKEGRRKRRKILGKGKYFVAEKKEKERKKIFFLWLRRKRRKYI